MKLWSIVPVSTLVALVVWGCGATDQVPAASEPSSQDSIEAADVPQPSPTPLPASTSAPVSAEPSPAAEPTATPTSSPTATVEPTPTATPSCLGQMAEYLDGRSSCITLVNAPSSDRVVVVDVAVNDSDGGLLVWSAPGVGGRAPDGDAELLGVLPYDANGIRTSGHATADGWWWVQWQSLEGWSYSRFLSHEVRNFCGNDRAEQAARDAMDAIGRGDVDALDTMLMPFVSFSWVTDRAQVVSSPLDEGLFDYTEPGTGNRYARPAAELVELMGGWFVTLDRESCGAPLSFDNGFSPSFPSGFADGNFWSFRYDGTSAGLDWAEARVGLRKIGNSWSVSDLSLSSWGGP